MEITCSRNMYALPYILSAHLITLAVAEATSGAQMLVMRPWLHYLPPAF